MSQYPAPSTNPNNAELLIWCLFLLGGADKFVDVEDLFLKTFELAPARLSWRTRPEIPDYKKCAKALQEIEDPKRSTFAAFMTKNGVYQRKLSMAGSEWCEAYSSHFAKLYSQGNVPSAVTQDDGKIIRTIESSTTYTNFLKNPLSELPLYEIADLFRCMPDADMAVWASRLDVAENAAKRNSRDAVVAFISNCREIVLTGTT